MEKKYYGSLFGYWHSFASIWSYSLTCKICESNCLSKQTKVHQTNTFTWVGTKSKFKFSHKILSYYNGRYTKRTNWFKKQQKMVENICFKGQLSWITDHLDAVRLQSIHESKTVQNNIVLCSNTSQNYTLSKPITHQKCCLESEAIHYAPAKETHMSWISPSLSFCCSFSRCIALFLIACCTAEVRVLCKCPAGLPGFFYSSYLDGEFVMEIYGMLVVAAGNQGAKEWIVLRSHRSGPFYLWIVMLMHHHL